MANAVPDIPEYPARVGRDRPLVHFVLAPPSFERPENFRRPQAPPLTLLTLAALAARHGWDVRLCDSLYQPIPDERPDLVGMTVYTQNAPLVYAMARRYRDQGVPVVLGGVHASMLPAEGLRHADAVVAGEAEGVMGEVLGDAAAGRLGGIYRGEWGAMDDVPGFAEYQVYGRQLRRRLYPQPFTYQTTRGCRFNCSFCSVIRINGRGQRRRDPAQVVEHFRELHARVRRPFGIYLVDDDFAADLEGSLALCEALAAADLPVSFGSQSSIGIGTDDEVLATVRRGGLDVLHNIGLDSFSRRDLVVVNKKNRPHTYADAVARIHRHGITVSGSLIFGIADEPASAYEEAGPAAAALGLDSAMFNILTPMPGTETFATMHREGRITSYDWALYDACHCVIEPIGLAARELEQLRVGAYRRYLDAVPTSYHDDARERCSWDLDRLVARHGPDDEPTWVSYEADPADLEDLVEVSGSDANVAISTAVELATSR
jgi:radical SAM superfamily enzyme YgiQ (UPF0313 family)